MRCSPGRRSSRVASRELETLGARRAPVRRAHAPRRIRSSIPTNRRRCRPATSWRSPAGGSCWWRGWTSRSSAFSKSTIATLLDIPAEVLDVVVTQADIDGRTLADLANEEFARERLPAPHHCARARQSPCFPRRRCTAATSSPSSGRRDGSPRPSARIGVPDRATDVTDMVLVAFGIVAGALIGIPALMLGGIEIGLSLSVGVLLGGLVCGWLRSMWPRFFGRIPAPTLWVFESIGLAGFVAVVGLNAGPDFVTGLRTSGVSAGRRPDCSPSWFRTSSASCSAGGCSRCSRACCSASAPAPEPRRRRWRRSRRPRRAPCRRSATASSYAVGNVLLAALGHGHRRADGMSNVA